MDSVPREILDDVMQAVGVHHSENITIIVTSSLNILLRQREVILQDGKYRLTREGVERLRLTMKLEPEGQSIGRSLDKLRVKILNSTLRGKKKLLQSRERVT